MPVLELLKRRALKGIGPYLPDVRNSIGELLATNLIGSSHWELTEQAEHHALACAGRIPENIKADIMKVFGANKTLALRDFGQRFLDLAWDKRTSIGRHLNWQSVECFAREEGIGPASAVCLVAAWLIEQGLESGLLSKRGYEILLIG